MEESASGSLVVGFSRPGLVRVQRICWMCLIAVFACGWIAVTDPGHSIKAILFRLLGGLLSIAGPFAMFMLLRNLARFKHRSALIIAEEGLTIGFTARPPFFLPWSSVSGIFNSEMVVKGQSIKRLIVAVEDKEVLAKHVDGFTRLASSLTAQPPLSIGMDLLDKTWEEIEVAANGFKRGSAGVLMAKVEGIERLLTEMMKQREAVLTHNGQPKGWGEQLRLPLQTGGECRVTMIRKRKGLPILVNRILAKGEKDLLTDCLAVSNGEQPEYSPIRNISMALWQIYDRHRGKMRFILDVFLMPMYERDSDYWAGPLLAERELALAPGSIGMTPSDRILYFGLSQPGEPDAATLTIIGTDANVLKEIDLLKLCGYRTVRELKEKLAYQNVLFYQDGGWFPYDPQHRTFPQWPERLEIPVKDGNIAITIDKNAVTVEKNPKRT